MRSDYTFDDVGNDCFNNERVKFITEIISKIRIKNKRVRNARVKI